LIKIRVSKSFSYVISAGVSHKLPHIKDIDTVQTLYCLGLIESSLLNWVLLIDPSQNTPVLPQSCPHSGVEYKATLPQLPLLSCHKYHRLEILSFKTYDGNQQRCSIRGPHPTMPAASLPAGSPLDRSGLGHSSVTKDTAISKPSTTNGILTNGYHGHSSVTKDKAISEQSTTNGILTNGDHGHSIQNGLPAYSADGISTNGNSHKLVATEDESMPIAVIGIGCRFPGDATSPDNLWKLISEGRNARGGIPKDRFNIDAFYHPAGERQGSVSK
jgi:hypothetical protein